MGSAPQPLPIATTLVAVLLLLATPARPQEAPKPPAAAPGGKTGAVAPAPSAGGTRPGAAAPTEADVAIALADLTKGLKLPTAEERAGVVARNAGVADAKVVKALAKYLKDKEPAVRLAALEALGVTAHADAIKELHHVLQSDDKLREDVELSVVLLKAIGRHADASSVKALATDAWKNPDATVARARLYALGNIQGKASIAQLMDLMNTDPTLPWDTSPYMEDFRVALAHLTGADHKTDKDAWRAWWRDHEKTLKLGPEAPPMPAELQSRWDEFWKLPAPAPKPPAAKGD